MDGLFSMQGRISRAPYAAGTILLPLVASVAAGLLIGTENAFASATGLLLLLATQVAVACHVVRRLHDLGRPGTHFWLLLIPVYNVYLGWVLLFKRANATDNQYGPSPLLKTVPLASA